MKPTIKLKTVTDGSVKATKNFSDLQKLRVYVGIPENDAPRPKGAKVTNAELAYIHTHGSPRRNIPPRPIIEPAIEADKAQIIPELKDGAKAALDGDKQKARTAFKRAGMTGQNIVRNWFTDPRNHWAPNAPSTIRRKKSARPLIDTSELRKSMTYVVAEKT
jgi:hypothetical protein